MLGHRVSASPPSPSLPFPVSVFGPVNAVLPSPATQTALLQINCEFEVGPQGTGSY